MPRSYHGAKSGGWYASVAREAASGQGDMGTRGSAHNNQIGLRWGEFIVGLYYENDMVSLGDGALSGFFVVRGG